MAAGHGGARPGAGRPKAAKSKSAQPSVAHYADALAYLEAVVRGDEPADGLRIAAARVVLPYQAPKKRATVESPAPRKLRASSERSIQGAEAEAWAQRAAQVRQRLKDKRDAR